MAIESAGQDVVVGFRQLTGPLMLVIGIIGNKFSECKVELRIILFQAQKAL